MKFLRAGYNGVIKPVMIDSQGVKRDISSIVKDVSAQELSLSKLQQLASLSPHNMPAIEEEVPIYSCLGQVGKFICIGLNYKDHVLETKASEPAEPVIFSKFDNAICGPFDDIHIPRNSQSTDWEIELGFVIGKAGLNIPLQNAMDHVLGYFIVIDFSERYFQKSMGGQWVKGKSYDTFGPLGPYLVTADSIDANNLNMLLQVDGVTRQSSNTSKMIFKVPFLVHYLSQFFTLQPGDVIATGTPAGVGLGLKPHPVYLTAGQEVYAQIEGLGAQKHIMVQD